MGDLSGSGSTMALRRFQEQDKEMTGLQKASALLISLGPDACAEVFKLLEDDEIEQLAMEIAEMRQVDPGAVTSVIQEFSDMISARDAQSGGGISYAMEALSKALDKEDTAEILGRIRAGSGVKPFDHLASTSNSAELFSEMIREEHPQTIALILAYLSEQRAADILASLPQELRSEVVTRIANMTTVSPDTISQIESTLRKKSREHKRVRAGGIRTAAEILNRLEPDLERKIMDSISDFSPTLAESISDLMFTYDDIVTITDSGIQKLMQTLDEKDLLMALKASTEAIQTKFLKNMSTRKRETIQEDLESMAPVRLKDAQAAQKRVLEVAKEMSQSGEIEIIRGSGQEVYV